MIPLCIPEIRGNELKYVTECIETNWLSSAGSYVDLFESNFKDYIGSKGAVSTINGTSALHLALIALGIGPGDEVIVPSLTFVAPANAVKYVGANPVFCDVCKDTYVMDVNKVEKLITNRTKCIIPVHLYGHPVDMDPLRILAERNNLYIVEDATEALGSKYKGKMAGNIGDIGVFSFNGNKIITTGAGGMLVSNDLNILKKVKYLSTQSKSMLENGGYYHEEVGYNYRMPNLLAALGVAQLENINEYVNIKRKNARLYNSLLKDVKGITIPVEKEWADSCYWLYSIVVEDNYHISRDDLIDKLSKAGIQSRPFFMPLHCMDIFKESYSQGIMFTQFLSKRGINLPSSVSLKKEEIEKIAYIIKDRY